MADPESVKMPGGSSIDGPIPGYMSLLRFIRNGPGSIRLCLLRPPRSRQARTSWSFSGLP